MLFEIILQETLSFAQCGIERIINNKGRFAEVCMLNNADPEIALDKLVAETSLFLVLSRRVIGKNKVNDLSPCLGDLARTNRHYALIREYPETAAGLVLTHTMLTSLGVWDEDFEATLKVALASPAVSTVQRPLFRSMEQRWIANFTADQNLASYDDLIEATLCASAQNAFKWDSKHTYAFTHELFYLTDFGRNNLSEKLNIEEVLSKVDDALLVQIALNDIDLLAELLMARVMLHGKPSPISHIAHSLLIETWHHYGFLPSPHLEETKFKALRSDLQPHYGFLGVYHTTYVGAMYCAQQIFNPMSQTQHYNFDKIGCINEILPALRQGPAPILSKILTNLGIEALPILADAVLIRARRFGTAELVSCALRWRQEFGSYSKNLT